MKNTSTSLFRQVLNLIPKQEFEEIIMKHDGDKHLQSFDCWSHFVSMIFCQLAQAGSLREICGGLKICGGKLNHPGMENAPGKSNLSCAVLAPIVAGGVEAAAAAGERRATPVAKQSPRDTSRELASMIRQIAVISPIIVDFC